MALDGLHIVLPLPAAAVDSVCASSGASGLSPPAGDVILVGDGGPTFFARFQAARLLEGGANPLDDFTQTRVQAAVDAVLKTAGIPTLIHYPFVATGARPLPFQRLGRAAGLPEPGPLGLQIHPVFGPWWAYRALIATPLLFESDGPALTSLCAPCGQPCVTACSVHAVGAPSGPSTGVPLDRCGDGCGARDRCPFGLAQRYPDAQIAFHARARERMIAAASR